MQSEEDFGHTEKCERRFPEVDNGDEKSLVGLEIRKEIVTGKVWNWKETIAFDLKSHKTSVQLFRAQS